VAGVTVPPPRRLVIVLLAGAVGLAPTACGSATTSSTTTRSAAAAHAQAVRFADCMRSHGVTNFPDPTPGTASYPTVPGNTQSPGFGSAEQACGHYVPQSTGSQSVSQANFSPAKVAQMQAQAIAMARCLRAHGVPQFPDPKYTAQAGGNFLPTFTANTCHIAESAPAFEAALKLCPTGLGGSFALAFIKGQQEDGAACAG